MREPRSFHGRPKLFLLNSASPPERLLAERASRVRCSHQTALWFHAIGFQSGMLSKKCCFRTSSRILPRTASQVLTASQAPSSRSPDSSSQGPRPNEPRLSSRRVSAGRTPRTAGRAHSPLHDTALAGRPAPSYAAEPPPGPVLHSPSL